MATECHVLHGSHHWWWSTHEDLDIVASGRHVLLNLLLRNETRAASPAGRWVVQDVVHCETVRVVLGQQVELLLQQNIFGVHVRVDQAELRAVLGVLQSSANDLQHWRDTSAASNHAEVTRQRWRVCELALGTLDAYLVAEFEKRDVARDVALLVGLKHVVRTRRRRKTGEARLDEQIKVTEVVVTACGRVAARYILAVDLRTDRDVLANWQTEHVLRVGKRKAVAAGLV